MKFTVVVLTRAKRELYENALWWAEHRDEDQAVRWMQGIEAAISGLAENPERHALTHEDDAFQFTLRRLLYGIGERNTHRVLFRIVDDKVLVYSIRHVSQRDVTPEDFDLN